MRPGALERADHQPGRHPRRHAPEIKPADRQIHPLVVPLLFPTYLPPAKIQGRLLRLAALFLFIYAVALTLSPAGRERTWSVDYRWSHWLGLLVWAVAFELA